MKLHFLLTACIVLACTPFANAADTGTLALFCEGSVNMTSVTRKGISEYAEQKKLQATVYFDKKRVYVSDGLMDDVCYAKLADRTCQCSFTDTEFNCYGRAEINRKNVQNTLSININRLTGRMKFDSDWTAIGPSGSDLVLSLKSEGWLTCKPYTQKKF